MSSTRANRVSPPTVTQYVIETVRADILSGRYPMNSRLDQQAIAAELGVSIIPVRECLRQLKGWCRFHPDVACSSSSCRSTSSARSTASAKCSKNWRFSRRCRT
ncbi:GntR family transcriptional regulator [Roseiflexus sp. RS-1]|uniref:GntR family transcriptional regulator n=1 Tax=Roseiflexus sp. (strain RS-1) TaxID=357808 RepID=UPI000A02718F